MSQQHRSAGPEQADEILSSARTPLQRWEVMTSPRDMEPHPEGEYVRFEDLPRSVAAAESAQRLLNRLIGLLAPLQADKVAAYPSAWELDRPDAPDGEQWARDLLELRDQAIHLWDGTSARSDWIPVSERLPELYAKVLTWDGVSRTVARLTPVGWMDSEPCSVDVTHWQPLPPPPGGSE